MSRTYTQEQVYQPAQSRLPRIQIPPAQGYQVAQPTQPPQIINPLLMAGAASAQANVELNRQIREDAKEQADEVFGPLYNRGLPGGPGGPPNPNNPPDGNPADDPEDDGDDQRPLIDGADRIIERHPPPRGVNREVFRQFIFDVLARADDIGRFADASQKLLTNATLIYHIWTERQYNPSYTGDNELIKSGTADDKEPKKIKPVEERMQDPIPPQCFRHIYKDEKGQLRTILICKTDGHAQRIYHDA